MAEKTPEEELLDDLRDLAERLDRVPTAQDVDEYTGRSNWCKNFIVEHCVTTRCRMVYDDLLKARTTSEMTSRVETVSQRTGLDNSEVIRRLVRLGLQDVDEVGDEILIGAVSDAAAQGDEIEA